MEALVALVETVDEPSKMNEGNSLIQQEEKNIEIFLWGF